MLVIYMRLCPYFSINDILFLIYSRLLRKDISIKVLITVDSLINGHLRYKNNVSHVCKTFLKEGWNNKLSVIRWLMCPLVRGFTVYKKQYLIYSLLILWRAGEDCLQVQLHHPWKLNRWPKRATRIYLQSLVPWVQPYPANNNNNKKR